MKRFLLVVLLGIFPLSVALAQDARYAANGITFDYPKGWKVMTEKPGGIVSITVQNDRGTQAIVQIHPADTDPKKARSEVEKVFRKAFEGKLVRGSEKAVRKKIAGSVRDGATLDFEVAKDVPLHFEFFAFPLAAKRPVVCMVFQYGDFDADAAGKGFPLISNTLAELKTVEVNRGKPVTGLVTTANKAWKVVGFESNLAYIADRDYHITKYPKVMDGGHAVIRDSGQINDWAQKGQMTLGRDATLYVAMLVNVDGREVLSRKQLDAMAADGWTFLKEPFETTTPDKTWTWQVAKKPVTKGEVELPLPKEFLFFRTHVIYVFR